MKLRTLTIYANDSVWKFEEIDKDYTYYRHEHTGIITIYKRHPIRGIDTPHKCFRNWDYMEWSYVDAE